VRPVVAITGSTGYVGGMVAAHLADRGPRLIVRDPSRAPHGDIRVATYGDAAASRSALEEVELLFMVSGSESPTRRDEHRTFVESAAAAGVRHIVYTSFAGAAPDAVFTLGRDHADTEAAIRASGMTYKILRDNFYSDLLPYFAGDDGVIRGPADVGRVAAVARADVADVASDVLRDPLAHANVTYELSGPESLTLGELAARAGAVLGRGLSFQNETLAEAYASRRQFSSEQWQLDAWVSTYRAIAEGEVATVSGDVERITGHPARTIEQALAR
jgi:uncharacterized protein YbjT (DUF2867 family)